MTSPEDFAKWLAYLGFDLANKEHWLRLGLTRAECGRHAGVIKNRMAQAQRIMEHGQNMRNIKITSSSWGEMYGRLVEAAGKCLRGVELLAPVEPGVPLGPQIRRTERGRYPICPGVHGSHLSHTKTTPTAQTQ